MNRQTAKLLVTGAAILCLAATTAWAGLQTECFCAHLNGVDRCGNLMCNTQTDFVNGCNATFVALVNTCDGTATGTATGCVPNYSCRLQIYINNCCFGYIVGICDICSSLYTVYGNGKAVLIATGKVCSPST
ncbi:MAG: hypothetical protein ACM3U2_16325 [Deltaproteobacteria bacterium]